MPIFKKISKQDYSKQYIISCSCSAQEHQLGISWFPGDRDGEVYFHYHLTQRPLLERIKQAIWHLFGYRSKYGNFDEIIIYSTDIEKLRSILAEARADVTKLEGKACSVSDFECSDIVLPLDRCKNGKKTTKTT